MEVELKKIKTSPQARERKKAYIEGLIAARDILKESDDMVDTNKNIRYAIDKEQRLLRKM